MPLEIAGLLLFAPVVLLLLGQALLAPVETLLWSAGWLRDERGLAVTELPTAPADPSTVHLRRSAGDGSDPDRVSEAPFFLVYLDGVGKTSPRDTRVARLVGERLGRALPGVPLITHVMPYAATNRPMLDRPWAGRYWRLLRRHHLRVFMFLNNALQVLVATDARYRRPYAAGVAHTLLAHLLDAGYRPGSGVPVVLLTYSGGTQAGAAAAEFLTGPLGSPPLVLIGIGGFHDGASDLSGVAAVHLLTSRADVVEGLARWIFPRRWRIWPSGHWRRALRQGRVHVHDLTPARHFGPRSYVSGRPLGSATLQTPSTTYLDRTIEVVLGIVTPLRARQDADPPQRREAAQSPTDRAGDRRSPVGRRVGTASVGVGDDAGPVVPSSQPAAVTGGVPPSSSPTVLPPAVGPDSDPAAPAPLDHGGSHA